MQEFYGRLDSGRQWVISRTGEAGGKPTRVNLDFAIDDQGKQRTSEGEEDLLRFARSVYEELTSGQK